MDLAIFVVSTKILHSFRFIVLLIRQIVAVFIKRVMAELPGSNFPALCRVLIHSRIMSGSGTKMKECAMVMWIPRPIVLRFTLLLTEVLPGHVFQKQILAPELMRFQAKVAGHQ